MNGIGLYNLYHKHEKRVFHVLLYSITLLGISLAIYQFFYNRSLWNDEAALALNIIDKSFSQLLQPLDYKQVAPIAYLFVEKFLTLLMGKSEYALRIFSLVAFILSILSMCDSLPKHRLLMGEYTDDLTDPFGHGSIDANRSFDYICQ